MKENMKHIAVLLLLLLVPLAFFACKLFLPEQSFSETERRKLKPLPTLTASSLVDGSYMTDFESYSLDRFPLRDTMRGLKAAMQLGVLRQKDNNGLYCVNGSIAKIEYPLHTDSILYAAEKFQTLYRQYLDGTDTKVYYAVIPDKNAFLAEENGYPHLDYDAVYSLLREELSGNMTEIPIAELLSADSYYRTDPHWRQEKLATVAERILKAMGAQTDAVYTAQTLSQPFYGVYAGQLALPTAADAITVLENEDFADCTVFDYENGKEIPVYDYNRAEGLDPYEVYLSGALPLLTIENPHCDNGRELVVFRDSFGSALAPLFISSYEKITLVDIRYLSSKLLGNYIDFSTQDVLFLYSTVVLNNSNVLK